MELEYYHLLWRLLMNDGLLSFLLYIIFIFIFIGSWISEELYEAKWKVRTILIILLFMILTPYITISMFQLTFGALVVLLPIILIALLLKMNDKEKAQVLIGGLLFAVVYNILLEMLAVDPVLLIMDDRLLIGILLGTIVGMFRISLNIKWVLATLGIWLGGLYFIFKHSELLHKIQLFSYYEIDLLYTLYLGITLIHLFSVTITKWVFKSNQKRT